MAAGLVLLGILAVWLLIDRSRQTQKVDELVLKLEESFDQKSQVQGELEAMLQQYDALRTDNDTLNASIAAQQERIQALMVEVEQAKASNFAKIEEYRRELETLRRITRGYVEQVDSLNQLAQVLRSENQELQQDLSRQTSLVRRISTEADSLNQRLGEAAIPYARSFTVTGLNENDRPTDKAAKVVKVQVCFTLSANAVARHGLKEIFVRVADPNEEVLFVSLSDLFEFGGESIIYSAKRNIQYDGQEAQACVFVRARPVMPLGTYRAQLYLEGKVIGSTTFQLL